MVFLIHRLRVSLLFSSEHDCNKPPKPLLLIVTYLEGPDRNTSVCTTSATNTKNNNFAHKPPFIEANKQEQEQDDEPHLSDDDKAGIREILKSALSKEVQGNSVRNGTSKRV